MPTQVTDPKEILDQLIESSARLHPFQVQATTHPAWLPDHPSGFGVVSKVAEGDLFFCNPQRIADTTTHLSGPSVAFYIDAIVRWWERSTLRVTYGFTPETVILDFAYAEPDAFVMFLTHPDIVASRHDLIDWLCPELRP